MIQTRMTAGNGLQDQMDHTRQAVSGRNTIAWRNLRGMRNRITHGHSTSLPLTAPEATAPTFAAVA